MELAVKFVKGLDDKINGLAIPFGGPNNGRDLEGEYFTADTDLSLPWFDERPVLYHHGLDGRLQSTPVGRTKSYFQNDMGIWVQAQLDVSSKYFSAIQKLIEQGKLFFSSGAMNHLVKIKANGEITKWPWVETSLTPVPANPYATVTLDTAVKHFKSIGVDISIKDFGKPKDDDKAPSKTPPPADKPAGPPDKSDGPPSNDPPKDGPPKDDASKGAANDQKPSSNDPNAPKADPAQAEGEAEAAIAGNDDSSGQIDLSGSYEAILEKLTAAVNPSNVATGAVPTSNQIIGTFPGFCIVQEGDVNSPGQGNLWKVDYAVDDQGNLTLGEAEAVAPEELTDGNSGQAAPVAAEAENTVKFARTLLSSTKGLIERRQREGRELSATNLSVLTASANALEEAANSLKTILKASANPTAKAGAADRDKTELDLLKLKEALE